MNGDYGWRWRRIRESGSSSGGWNNTVVRNGKKRYDSQAKMQYQLFTLFYSRLFFFLSIQFCTEEPTFGFTFIFVLISVVFCVYTSRSYTQMLEHSHLTHNWWGQLPVFRFIKGIAYTLNIYCFGRLCSSSISFRSQQKFILSVYCCVSGITASPSSIQLCFLRCVCVCVPSISTVCEILKVIFISSSFLCFV